jgi:hypothetical protein
VIYRALKPNLSLGANLVALDPLEWLYWKDGELSEFLLPDVGEQAIVAASYAVK